MNCAVDNYDDLTVSEVASAVQQLTDTAALTALLRYEQNHKDRAGAVTAIENRLAALVERTSAETDGSQRPGCTRIGVRPGGVAQHYVECPHGVPSACRLGVYQSYIDWQEAAALHEIGPSPRPR